MKIPQSTFCLLTALYFLNSSFSQNNNHDFIPQELLEVVESGAFQNAIATADENTFIAAFKATGLDQLINEDIPFTIFAPSDVAFSKLTSNRLTDLLNSTDKNELISVLKYHIVAGKLTAAKILKALCNGKGETSFTTVQGNKIKATMEGIDIVLTDNMGNSAKITTADTKRGKGVVHEIDSVILPGNITKL